MISRIPALLLVLALLPGSLAPAQPDPDGKVVWRSIGPGEFGAMFGVAFSPRDPRMIVAGLDMGNAFLTRDGGKSWKIIGRNGGEPYANPAYRGTWGVCFDPKRPERIFIGSEHGLFRSTDSGENWRLMQGGGPEWITKAMAIDPENPDVVYAASGMSARQGVSGSRGEVWRSTDGGDTWHTMGQGGPLEKAAVRGANWVTIAIDVQSPLTARGCHGRIYLCGQSGFFVSEDGGDTWASLEEKLPGGIGQARRPGINCRSICDLALAPGRDRATLFASIMLRYTDPERTKWLGGVYRSDDGGGSWMEKNHGLEESLAGCAKGQSKYCLLAACAAQPKVMYLNNGLGVFKTEDEGESWHSVVHTGGGWIKDQDPEGHTINRRVRDWSGNFDQSYYNIYGPANGLAVCPTDPNAVAYTDNAGMGLSYDGGAHWTEPGYEFGEAVWPGQFGDRPPMQLTHKVRSRGLQLINPQDAAIDPFDPETIAIAHADTGLEISRDGGTWWEWAWKGFIDRECNYMRAVLFDPAVKNRLYAGGGGWGTSGHVYRSDDGGRTFTVIGIPQLSAEAARTGKLLAIHALALDQPAHVLYAGTDFGLFKTADGGQTWQPVPLRPGMSFSVHELMLDPKQPGRVYAAAFADGRSPATGLYGTENGGATWNQLAPDKLGGPKSIALCPKTGTLYAIAFKPGSPDGYWTERALWRSDDHGATWRKIDERRGCVVAVNPTDPDRVYVMVFAQDISREKTNVYRSLNGGMTWKAIADDIPLSPGENNRIVFDPSNPSRFLLTHDSGTYIANEP